MTGGSSLLLVARPALEADPGAPDVRGQLVHRAALALRAGQATPDLACAVRGPPGPRPAEQERLALRPAQRLVDQRVALVDERPLAVELGADGFGLGLSR